MAKKLNSICDKVTEFISTIDDDISSVEENISSVEEKLGVKIKFLNREHINSYTYYYYLVSNKYVLQLTFRNNSLVYVALFAERPTRTYLCEKEL